jgi:hypothetical protein
VQLRLQGNNSDVDVELIYHWACVSALNSPQRGMENLALLAVQAQNVISSGNAVLNATQVF